MSKNSLVMDDSHTSIITEAFRAFRTNILYSNADENIKSILFTSAGAGEGKSVTAANTAVALAQAGQKVIILDCDLRKPFQHKIFEQKNIGLTNFFYERCPITDFIQTTSIPDLRLVASGPVPPNPSELLATSKMREAITLLRSQADYLIIDSPPVLPVTDACILGSKVDGIILVVGVGKVKPEMAQRAKEHLETAKGNILGIIINRSETYLEQSAYDQYYGNMDKIAN